MIQPLFTEEQLTTELTDRELLLEIHAMLKTLTTAKVVKRKPAKAEYSNAFEQAWKHYPRRDGSNPKRDAFGAWNQRVSEGCPLPDLIDGVKRYAKWCEANGNVGTGYVMQAVRFFGPSLSFRESWAVESAAIDWSKKTDPELLRACQERKISTHGMSRFALIERLQQA